MSIPRSLGESIATRYVAARWVWLALAAALAAVSYPLAQQIRFDQAIEPMFSEHDPLLPPYRKLKRTFAGNEIILAFYRDPGLFEPGAERLAHLASVSRRLKAVPGVRDTLSLAEVRESLQGMTPAAELLRLALGTTTPAEVAQEGLFREVASVFAGYTHAVDGKTAAVICMLDADRDASESRGRTIDALRAVIRTEQEGMLVGEPVMVTEGFRYLERDGRRLGWLSLCLLAGVLACSFRSLRWVLLALAVVQLSLLITRATLVASGMHLSMVSSMLQAIVTVIGVATVVHVIVRYRSARGDGLAPDAAMVRTVTLLAAPVFWACATDAVGFASLMVAQVVPVRDFGRMMAIAAMAVLISVALLTPAVTLLSERGRLWHRWSSWICRLRREPGRADVHPEHSADPQGRSSGPAKTLLERRVQAGLVAMTDTIGRHRRTILICLLILVLFSISGVGRLHVETDFTKNFRRDSEIAGAYRVVESELGGAGVWDVMIPAPDKLDSGFLQRIRDLQARLRTPAPAASDAEGHVDDVSPRVLRVLSLVDVIDVAVPLERLPAGWVRESALASALVAMQRQMPDFADALYAEDPADPGNWYYRIMLRSPESSPAEWKRDVMKRVDAECSAAFPGAAATGIHVLVSSLVSSVVRDQWLTFVVAVIAIFLTMWIAVRRLDYALIALVPNALPILVVLGWMGWLGVPLNMGAAMIAAVSVGLSVDSSIHFLAAYRRERLAGQSVDAALHSVQRTVGLAACFSTFALVVGFAALTSSEFVPTIYFGSLVSVAMLGGLSGNLVLLPLLLGRLDSRCTG